MGHQGLGPNGLDVGIQGLGSKALDPRLWMGTQGLESKAVGSGAWIQGPWTQSLGYKAFESKVSQALNPFTTVNSRI